MNEDKVIEVLAKELREQLDFMYGNNLPIEYSRAVVRRALSEAGLEIVQKDRWQSVSTMIGPDQTQILAYFPHKDEVVSCSRLFARSSGATLWQPLPSKPQQE